MVIFGQEENKVRCDPRKKNRNGKMFKEFLTKNPHLRVVNALPLCRGLVTRSKLRNRKLEESVLDKTNCDLCSNFGSHNKHKNG